MCFHRSLCRSSHRIKRILHFFFHPVKYQNWSSTLCELNISVNDLREEVVWSLTPFFFTSTPAKLDWSDCYHVGKLLWKYCRAAVPTLSYWFIATVSKINEKTALHCNMHITKMLTDILQLFVWIKPLVCLAACFPLLKVMFACLFH